MEHESSYPNWTREQVHQLIDSLGEEKAKEIVDGKVSVEFKEVVNKLFDETGRRIPKGLQANVCDVNEKYRINKLGPNLEKDFASRIERLHKSLNVDTEITGAKFKEEFERLLKIVREDPRVSNITNGSFFPVVLPKLITNDLGSELELYLLAVNHSYNKVFDNRKFDNYRQGTLAERVYTVGESRHDQLIEKMKEGPVVGLCFPKALQGFSGDASREQLKTLPEEFILSGLDTVIAMIMYPDVLACDINTSNLDLAALQWRCLEHSLSFKTYDDMLSFGRTYCLKHADDGYSGGLLFLG